MKVMAMNEQEAKTFIEQLQEEGLLTEEARPICMTCFAGGRVMLRC
jgi:hypothetical protein